MIQVMRKILLLALALLSSGSMIFSQDYLRYYELVDEASALYDSGAYMQSGMKYSEAFVTLGNKGTMDDRYNAACSWALAGNADSSFSQLFRMSTKMDLKEYDYLVSDADFNSLHTDPRWQEVLELVRTNKAKAEASLDMMLVVTLDTIRYLDQHYRLMIDSLVKAVGWDAAFETEEYKTFFPVARRQDSLNLIKVKKMISEYGWPGPDLVGEQGNQTIFLVIQHADLDTQLEYLPLMREAVKEGKARARELAYLEDRVALGLGKKQKYGSQMDFDEETQQFYVIPLEDPDSVDIWRVRVGLPPISQYAAQWGIKWDVEEYKKRLPELEKK